MSDDLVARLRHAWDERERQLAEDERVALACAHERWGVSRPPGFPVTLLGKTSQFGGAHLAEGVQFHDAKGNAMDHAARHDPARVLAEVERGRRDIAAKRLMVEECVYEIGKSAPRSKLNDLAWSMLLQLAEAEGLA